MIIWAVSYIAGVLFTFLFNLLWVTFVKKSEPTANDVIVNAIFSIFFVPFWIWLIIITFKEHVKFKIEIKGDK